MLDQLSFNDAAHLIQTVLTPVFLLSGIGTLLNVFAGRLARVADQADALTKSTDEAALPTDERLCVLKRRALILDIAVVLATGAAAATCLSILALFLFALSKRAIATILLLLFGLAILLTLGSIIAFGLEMVLSNRAMRRRITLHRLHLPWHTD